MSAIKNAQQVKDLLTSTLANNPEKYAATLNYVVVDMFHKLMQIASKVGRIDKDVGDLKAALGQLFAQAQAGEGAQTAQGGQPQGAPPAAQPSAVTEPNGTPVTASSGAKYVGGVRLGADGLPMSPEEQMLEERFDAASGS